VWRYLIFLSTCSVITGSVSTFTGCNSSSNRENATPKKPTAKSVQAFRVKETPQNKTVSADGSLAAMEQATLSTKVPGRIQKFPVDLGTKVTQGQLLAQIDPRDFQLRVSQTEAQLIQARVRLGLPAEGTNDAIETEKTSSVRQTRALLEEAKKARDRLLELKGIVPRSELESAESAYEVALSRHENALEDARMQQAVVKQRRAELELAQQQLTDAAILAPFDGVVQERHANIGEHVPASAAVVTVVRMDPLRLRLDVAERDAPQIRIGQKVSVRIEGSAQANEGEITRLSPVIDELTRTLRVEADVKNPDHSLRPGSFARAEIVTGVEPRSIILPKSAVVVFAGIEKVFAIEDGKAVEIAVTTGRWHDETVEIISGLPAGKDVVLAPGNLQSGQPVTVMN
jgi:RND family efflux transporter MFP subunit